MYSFNIPSSIIFDIVYVAEQVLFNYWLVMKANLVSVVLGKVVSISIEMLSYDMVYLKLKKRKKI